MAAHYSLIKISLALGALSIANGCLLVNPTASAIAAESGATPKTTQASTAQAAPTSKDSPKEVYLKYFAAMSAPNATLASIKPFQSKKTLAEIAKDKDADQILGFIKLMMPPSAVVLSETISGKTATLKLTCSDVKETNPFTGEPAKSVTKGEAMLVQEDGIWKVEKESWSTKVGDAVDTPSSTETTKESSKASEPAKESIQEPATKQEPAQGAGKATE